MKNKIIWASLVVALFFLILTSRLSKETIQTNQIRHYTAFFSTEGNILDSDNKIKQQIAEKIGADCEETWLVGQTKENSLRYYIASGEYPDFISGEIDLYQAGVLIPIDEYWDKYPNIKQYLSSEKWDLLRQEDGHIYWIPQFGVVNGENTEVIHEGEAFWIQTRVLKWAGYPKIHTVEQYFELLENYIEANPVMENGTPNIPFTLLCDDWRYFCLENVPQFLDGYPNEGCCIVEPDTLQIIDYNITDTAKRYFKILNEEYQKGILSPEVFTNTYSEYLDKLSTGAVLGMVDQWWEFYYDIRSSFERQNLSQQGCNYVPLPITIDENIKNQWHVNREAEFDTASGLSITTSCTDVEGALQFVNDLLDPEIQKLRFWGNEGIDYSVDEEGLFYLTQEQHERNMSEELATSYFCGYSYFPRVEGKLPDGINAFSIEYQPHEFLNSLNEDVRECLLAYGCENYVEMLGSNEAPGEWYPLYSYTNSMNDRTDVGRVWNDMTAVKQAWLPQVIMTDDFDGVWSGYMREYEACNPKIFFDAVQIEVERRVKKEQ